MEKQKSKQNFTPVSYISFFNLQNLILFAVFLIISAAFFWRLDSVLGVGFGFKEIIYSIVIGILITTFLIWIKSITKKSSYLGLSIGFMVLITFIVSVRTKYVGPNTTVFIIIFTLAFGGHIAWTFLKYLKNSEKKEEFDDKIQP